jgi:putative transposase
VTLEVIRRYSMSEFKKLAHALWQCKYHIVFCPKYRFKILKGTVAESVNEFLTLLCRWKRIEMMEMSLQEDHVHLVLSVPPKHSVSEVVGFLKEKKCAIKMFDRHLDLKK